MTVPVLTKEGLIQNRNVRSPYQGLLLCLNCTVTSVHIVINGIKLREIPKEQHMKLRTTVGTLFNTFALTSPTLDNKGSSSNLYLNANDKSGFLYLYSTNLICETATKIRVEVEEGGEVLINPSKLEHGLAELPKDTPVSLSLSALGNTMIVQASSVKFSLAANTGVKELGDKMRAIPFKEEPIAIIPAKELKEFASRAMFCIPNDQTGQRANLAAMKLSITNEGEEAYATDGSIAVRLSSSSRLGKGKGLQDSLLVPAPALQALNSLVTKKNGETVSIIVTDNKNKVYFRFADGTHFGALTMATPFPNLKPVIDQETTFVFDISRELFKKSLSRASFFVSSATSKKTLELEFGSEKLDIKANGDDILSDNLPIIYKGKPPTSPIKLGMNIAHLLNITSSSQSKDLTIGFTGPTNPLTISDTDNEEDDKINVKYVVMGVRL